MATAKARASPPPRTAGARSGMTAATPPPSAPPRRTRNILKAVLAVAALFAINYAVGQSDSALAYPVRAPLKLAAYIFELVTGLLGIGGGRRTVQGHADFGDGRATHCPAAFAHPQDALYYVNVNLGNGGPEPDLSGGMIPSVAPPFGMTRWTAQTRRNYVSMCPYNQTDTHIHGFIGTHQPAVWMGESGPAQIAVGLGKVVTDFEKRKLPFERKDEYASQTYYRNVLRSEHGPIEAEMSATSRVGHLRFTFPDSDAAPFVVLDGARVSSITNNPLNTTYPLGGVRVEGDREIVGWSDERQDHILVGDDLPARGFKGYFVARFSEAFESAGVSQAGEMREAAHATGSDVSVYAQFPRGTRAIDVRVGVSFISVEQARRNIDLEIPDGQDLEETASGCRLEWAAKLNLLKVQGATEHNRTVLYTGFSRTLVYPYEVHENTGTFEKPEWQYYSGYADKVVPGQSYSGYSIWDTFRATTAWQLFLAPERVPAMLQSMLQDYDQGGWLPMWKNIVETNIMVGTHADSIFAQALKAGVQDVDWDHAWAAVRKDAFTPPDRDTELRYFDREEHTPQEVRAGLTEYLRLGYVADDLHSEAGSRTLDYAYDDHAAAIVAEGVGAHANARALRKRAKNYRQIWNNDTGFMEARNSDGTWAGWKAGWTEGDHWAYSLTVMHDVPGLIELMGGDERFVDFIDRHFDGGHNLHTNEPSHHIPYLYAFADGSAHKTQEVVRMVGENEYNHTDIGLSGNEDCGQMSAWYLFSMLGFYPVDPASATYVVGAPFFDRLELALPSEFGAPGKAIVVTAPGASTGAKYVRGLRINGRPYNDITIPHAILADGAEIEFEMSHEPQAWPQKPKS